MHEFWVILFGILITQIMERNLVKIKTRNNGIAIIIRAEQQLHNAPSDPNALKSAELCQQNN